MFQEIQHHKTIVDVITPDYFNRIKSGEIINNPCTRTECKGVDSRWDLTARFAASDSHGCVHYDYLLSGEAPSSAAMGNPYYLSSFAPVPDIDISGVSGIAITNAYANVDSSSANLYATAGELQETISSLVSIFKRVITIYKALKRFDVSALRKELTAKELADRYMEYRYAIRPLYYEATGIIDAFSSLGSKHDRFTFRGSHSKTDTSVAYGTINLVGIFNHTSISTTIREVKARAGVLTSIAPIGLPEAFGVDDIFEGLWELVPFSFVLDWFFNVGKTLASWTPELGVKELASWVTVTDTVSSVKSCGSLIGLTTDVYDVACQCQVPSPITRYEKTYTRTPNPSRSILPKLDIKLDTLKLLDLAIILKNIL
jgi:hypothetical protein